MVFHQFLIGSLYLACVMMYIACDDDVVSPFHKKPLGAHIPPDDVDEVTVDNMISPKDFTEKYIFPRKPLVFRGIVKDWPAFSKWTDDYLKEHYPNLEMRMEGRKEKLSATPQGDIALGRDSLAHFINTYHNKDVNKYVVSELPTPLYKYVKIPPPLGCGNLLNQFVEIDMWINSGGARSVVHKDAYNTINCVVNGSKEWKLIEFQYNDLIYQAYEGPGEAGWGGYSLINPEKVDLKKYPKITKIPRWQYAHIKAGDCLHLPSQMWHVVKSHGDMNLAVAFLFSQFFKQNISAVNFEDCADKPNAVPLDQVDVEWKYPGYGQMSMGNGFLSDYEEQIRLFFSPKTRKLSKKHIYRTLKMSLDGFPKSTVKILAKKRTLELYEKLTNLIPAHKLKFSTLKYLPRPQLREIINSYIEPFVGSNSIDYEYSHFSPDVIYEFVDRLSKENDGVIQKKKFIDGYLQMGGNIKVADVFWNKYGGHKEEVKFKHSKDSLKIAMEKFEMYRMDDPDEEINSEARHDIYGGFKSEERHMKPDFKDEDDNGEREEEEQERAEKQRDEL